MGLVDHTRLYGLIPALLRWHLSPAPQAPYPGHAISGQIYALKPPFGHGIVLFLWISCRAPHVARHPLVATLEGKGASDFVDLGL